MPETLDLGAISLHETYLSFIRAGFTPAEALELIKTYLATATAVLAAKQQGAE